MRNFGTNEDWDRAFWAPRTDAPLCASIIASLGHVSIVMPPVMPSKEAMDGLLEQVKDRIERPVLLPGQTRKK